MRIKSIVPAIAIAFAVAVLIVALGARPVLAGEEREYVGETTVSTLGNVGLQAMHDLCAKDFKEARMCSSYDLIRNGARPLSTLPVSAAWMNPMVATHQREPGGGNLAADISGVTSSKGPQGLSCAGWRLIAGERTGLAFIRSPVTISLARCDHEFPVACCSLRKTSK